MCDPSKPLRGVRARKPRRLARVAGEIRDQLLRVWRFVIRGRGPAVEVLVTDSARRRVIERELRGQLRRLRHALGTDLPVDAIVVQQVVPGESANQERAGSTQATTRSDGRRRTVMLLALQANGRRLSTDEVLAALAIQAMTLVGQAGTAELPRSRSTRPRRLRLKLGAHRRRPKAHHGPFTSRTREGGRCWS